LDLLPTVTFLQWRKFTLVSSGLCQSNSIVPIVYLIFGPCTVAVVGTLLSKKSAITEFLAHISPAVHCTLFHRGFLNCSPTKQELCWEYFLTQWNYC